MPSKVRHGGELARVDARFVVVRALDDEVALGVVVELAGRHLQQSRNPRILRSAGGLQEPDDEVRTDACQVG